MNHIFNSPIKINNSLIYNANGLQYSINFELYIKQCINKLKFYKNNTYCIIPMDLGTMLFIRKVNNNYDGFVMSQDDWGQYGDNSIKKILDDFLFECYKI